MLKINLNLKLIKGLNEGVKMWKLESWDWHIRLAAVCAGKQTYLVTLDKSRLLEMFRCYIRVNLLLNAKENNKRKKERKKDICHN